MSTAPALPQGQFEYSWSVLDEPIVCHLEYSPAEGDGWNEPHYPDSVSLCAAYLNGTDLLDLLSAQQCRRIEELALIEHTEYMRGEADEARIQHYIKSREYA
jgi:hypothetical protein